MLDLLETSDQELMVMVELNPPRERRAPQTAGENAAISKRTCRIWVLVPE